MDQEQVYNYMGDPSKIKDVKRPSSVPRGGPKPSPASSTEPTDYYPMHAGRELFITSNGKHKLSVFCYHGEAKNLLTIFKTIELCLEIDGDDFQYYEGPNSTVVRQEHQESSWLAFYPWRPKTYKLELYKQSCIGIETSKPYKMILRARYILDIRDVYSQPSAISGDWFGVGRV
ncbi:hypothetical protein Pcinc_021705 [Petrolisthes cinctipes]|uniref:Uncharacterized protein n=1 Tax=Petrolisthes cinctipes TaxID=88211 RepID=A0AAE1KH46_PETCI|nr:hypothetical protein Pcinc_021705 [Petrolisthes cinctipes]